MVQGQFCFITDEYFAIHDKDRKLMRNKESIDGKEHGRPCFYAFPDRKNPLILWCVPISSQIDKYAAICDHKLKRQRDRGVKSPKCNTIRFGEIMGVKKAFLIQNMFPVTMRHVGDIYVYRQTQEAVRIPRNLERDIITHSEEVLRLVRSGHRNLVFSDVTKIYADLVVELARHDRLQPHPPAPTQKDAISCEKPSMKVQLQEAKRLADEYNANRNDSPRRNGGYRDRERG
jgi:hypothetical protein